MGVCVQEGTEGLYTPGGQRGEHAEPQAGWERGAPRGRETWRTVCKEGFREEEPQGGGTQLYLLLVPARQLTSR